MVEVRVWTKQDDDADARFSTSLARLTPLQETDPVTKQPVSTAVSHPKVTRDLYRELQEKAGNTSDRKRLHQLADFLGQMFTLDPDKRITVSNALAHPFLKKQQS
mmetsp:Transcript_1379/g.3526  ORF Transcript_1379/g.3526 Transcript_1379/m.3526 type:complete len:105 (-) Transcript_1379:53-367(-)